MNGFTHHPEQADGMSAVPVRDMQRALALVLRSPDFARAPRMSQLLSFLVEATLRGAEEQCSEYKIGLTVFRRDPDVYHPALDPVVRVQMGRLRERLAACYRKIGVSDDQRIVIPAGSYVPELTAAAARAPWRCRRLQLAPLRNLTRGEGNDAFVCGLNEELGAVLFRVFGDAIQLHGGHRSPREASPGRRPIYRLEGSIRMEEQHVRASMRLVDAAAGRIAWVSQFNRRGKFRIPLQEALAGAICAELQRYLISP
jgi:TolB-like protein